MSHLQKLIGDETEICLLFANDVVLGNTDIVTLQNALSKWDKILKDHGLKISVKKTEFLPCPFPDPERSNPDIFIGEEKLMVSSGFKYLGSVINNEASCDDDIKHRSNVRWMKWREKSSVFCDKKMPRKFKGKLYATLGCLNREKKVRNIKTYSASLKVSKKLLLSASSKKLLIDV